IQGQPKPGKPFPVVRPETFDSVLVFCPFLSGLPCLADTLLSNRKLRNKPVPGPGDCKGRPYILCGHRLDNGCMPTLCGVRRRFFSTSSRSLLFTTRVLQMFPDSLSSNIYAKEGRWTGKTGCEEERNGQGRPCRGLKEASNTRGQYWRPRTSDRRGGEGTFHS